MLVRRLLIALAVLIALTALAAGVDPEPRDDGDPAPQSSAFPAGAGKEVERTISTSAKGADRRVTARIGELVRLTVEGTEVDSVELGDLEVAPLDPESPAIFELLAEEEGSYPIRLLDANRTIGTLVVTG